jgi:hypothetical protein
MAAQSGTVPSPALVRFVLAALVEVAESADVVASAEVAGEEADVSLTVSCDLARQP